MIRIPVRHKYVPGKQMRGACVHSLRFYASDHILAYLTHLVLTKSDGSRRIRVPNCHKCSEITWRKHTYTPEGKRYKTKEALREKA